MSVKHFERRTRRVWAAPSLFILWLALALPTMTPAQDASLYDAPLPDDAAFVRFLGFAAEEDVALFGRSFSGTRLAENDYNVLRADRLEGVSAGEIVTVMRAQDNTLQRIAEPARNALKVLVTLANTAADQTVSLKTADGTIVIIPAIGSGQLGFREVNPVQLALQVFGESGPIGESVDVVLRRNEHPTIIVGPDAEVRLVYSVPIPEPVE